MMPEMDGLQLSTEIHADARLAGTEVVMVSSSARVERSALEEGGIVSFMRKPLRSSRLHDVLCTMWVARQQGESIDLLSASPQALNTDARGVIRTKLGSAAFDARVLLVDDIPANQMVVSLSLESYGCEVVLANNGQEALDRMGEQSFDLVLMDWHMPVMDGFEATRRVRAMDGPVSKTTIVTMTAAAFRGDEQKSIDAGMDDYLTKPITKRQILEALRRHCGGLERKAKAKVTATAPKNSKPGKPAPKKPDPPSAPSRVDPQVLQVETLEQLERDMGADVWMMIAEMHVKEITSKLESLPAELAAKRLDVVERHAHNIKTCALSIGAMALGERAKASGSGRTRGKRGRGSGVDRGPGAIDQERARRGRDLSRRSTGDGLTSREKDPGPEPAPQTSTS